MMGHNTAPLNETPSGTAEMPTTMNLVNRIGREWRVTNTGMSDSYSMDFTLASFANFSANPADLNWLVDDDGNFTDAIVFKNGLTFTVNGNIITVSGMNTTQIPLNSTRFITLATGTIPAPVNLLNFSAKANNEIVNLNWQTAQKENVGKFVIERSIDNNTWSNITTVSAIGSNSKYAALDNEPVVGKNLYRLKMIDLDGQFADSEQQQVNVASTGEVKGYPNPVSMVLTVEATARELKTIKIYNALGQEISTLLEMKPITESVLQINFATMPKGNYLIKTKNSITAISH